MKTFLYIDIEIARDTTVPDDLFSIARDKNPDQISFLPAYNQVIAIAIGGMKDGTFQIRSLKGTEPEMITELFRYVDKFTLTGFNILSFDLPFIALRAMHHNIPVPSILKTFGLKPWEYGDRYLDLMQVFKVTGTRYYNLADMCLLLGIPTPKTMMDGSQVQQFYDEGKLSDIEEYNRADVRATYDLHQKAISLKLL